MKPIAASGACLLLALAFLAGCGEKKTVAARVNKDVITEEEFNQRTRDVNAAELGFSAQRGGAARAGEFAMHNLIQEKLVLQLAAEKQASPSDAQINSFLDYAKKFPELTQNISRDTLRTDAEKRHDLRIQLAVRNLLLKPLTITPQDLQQMYAQAKPTLAQPDQYHLRIVDVSSPQKAQQVLAALKSNVPFETVALKMAESESTRQKSGDIGFVRADNQFLMPVLATVKNLKPGDYTKKAIELPTQLPSGMMRMTYVVAQMLEKKPGRTPTMEEVRPYLEERLVQVKDPNAATRVTEMMREQVKKADIQINLKRYADIGKKIKDAASAPPAAMPPAP